MIDTKQLIEYVKHPDLALQNLSELMEQLESEDETIQNYSTEALENCGAPRPENIEMLLHRIESGTSQQVYWSSTLLGRLRPSTVQVALWAQIQFALCNAVCKQQLDLSARERAAWALRELGPLDNSTLNMLRPLIPDSPPRLQRLLESALSKSS